MTMLGFRINPAPPRPPAVLLDAFRGVVTPHISDNMNRLCGVVGLARYNGSGKLVGTAFTVKTRPGDNLMVHKALDLASAGDVVVVDGGGALENALVGELMTLYARSRGIAGFVIDGAIRDVATFAASDFPCYARGHVHRGPYKDGPGEINVPVAIGGLVIHPGDVLLGDEDGLVAFPAAEAASLLEQARLWAAKEEAAKTAISEQRYDRSWIDETLRAKGVLPPEGRRQ
jgi:RraA family protein